MNKRKDKGSVKRKHEDSDDTNNSKQRLDDDKDVTTSENSDTENSYSSRLQEKQKSDNGATTENASNCAETSSPEENCETTQDSETSADTTANTGDSRKGGMLLFSGGTNWDLIGRKELPKHAKGASGPNLWGPHRLSALQGIRVVAVASGSVSCHSVIITTEGDIMTWGRNDKGQLGLNDTIRREKPCYVEGLKGMQIISASCGRGHTLFLSDRGNVYSCGDNKMGQCGTGSQAAIVNIPTKISFKGRPVMKIACGADFSAIVDSTGGLHTFGCPEYGQLGHNSDGKYFVTSNKMSFRCELSPRRVIAFMEKTREGHVSLVDDVCIVDIACGINHSVALDHKKRCYSWGFGGYGRLGHAEQKDELVPRLLKTFDTPNRGVKEVFAGGTYSLAINEYGVLYFWGQNKKTGEATMYPKSVQDLTGWNVRAVGCSNTSIVCLADDSVISWGPSPTYGELCYGDNRCKSSTTPQEAKILDGLHIINIACGSGHTMLIARDETEEDRNKLNALPEFDP